MVSEQLNHALVEPRRQPVLAQRRLQRVHSPLPPTYASTDPSPLTTWSASSSTTPLLSRVGSPCLRSDGSSVCTSGPWGPLRGPAVSEKSAVAVEPARA